MEIPIEDADAVRLFMTLASQWRMHPMAGRTGLDYAAIAPTAAMLGLAMTPALFADLRVMESAAMAVWAAR